MKNNKIIKSKMDIFYLLLSLILIGLVIYVSIKTGKFLVDAIKLIIEKYPTISVALITGFLAFISVIIGKYLENKYNVNNNIREERQKIYIEFLDWLINNVLYDEISKNKNIIKELRKQQKYMTIYASDKVLKAWADFKDSAMKSESNKSGLSKEESTKFYLKNEAPKIEDLILAIRKELGYKNKNVKRYDILKLYINDLDKYL